MDKFPSINQFRNTIRAVQNKTRYLGKDETGEPIYDHTRKLPTLRFEGTVKLHGTNAAIVFDRQTHEISYQSRSRVLSLESDNAAFMLSMKAHEEAIRGMFLTYPRFSLMADTTFERIAIYGEWCGGSIQAGVALNGLDKMFVVFGVRYLAGEGEMLLSVWDDPANYSPMIEQLDRPFYLITNFPTFELDIDFNRPEIAQNKMIELTEQVEAECPVGKHFGKSGVGEGVVWNCIDTIDNLTGWHRSSDLTFKVKGEKHSNSKVRTLAPVDVEAIENVNNFIEYAVTEARLTQGLAELKEQGIPFEMKHMGDFIRWVFTDVIKEETDTIVENQLDPKKLGGPIANKARPWFIDQYNLVAA